MSRPDDPSSENPAQTSPLEEEQLALSETSEIREPGPFGRWFFGLMVVCPSIIALALLWSFPPLGLAKTQELKARQHQLEKMTPEQKSNLAKNRKHFAKLLSKEKKRLCSLHEQIEKDQQAHELDKVMKNYCEWLKTLAPYQRAELATSSVEKRIATIQRIRKQQEKDLIRRLHPQDAEGLLRWIHAFVERHESQILKSLPSQARDYLKKIEELPKRRMMFFAWAIRGSWRGRRPPPKTSVIEEKEMKLLLTELLPSTQKRLIEMPLNKQREIVGSWFLQLFRSRGPFQRSNKVSTLMTEKELAEFFENDLTPKERDQLLSRSGEEMEHELRRLYIEKNFKSSKGNTDHSMRPPGPPFRQRTSRGNFPHTPPEGSLPGQKQPPKKDSERQTHYRDSSSRTILPSTHAPSSSATSRPSTKGRPKR